MLSQKLFDEISNKISETIAADLRLLPEADVVQHDALWRQRLSAWLAFGGRVVQVVAVLLGLGVLLVVGNTVRLDIGARSEEIAVLQHLGATDAFVRRPFLYLGAWYGLEELSAPVLLDDLVLRGIGVLVVGIAGGLGAVIGAVSGYLGHRVDNLIMRVMDVVLSFPPLVLAMALAGTPAFASDWVLDPMARIDVPYLMTELGGGVVSVEELDGVLRITVETRGAPTTRAS